MIIKEFSNGLIVKTRRSAVIFETEVIDPKQYDFRFTFSEEEWKEFKEYMTLMASKAWKAVIPKEASSEASDYWEYYDKPLDNNGYLSIEKMGFGIFITRPSDESNRLYQFNIRKMESFLYDLNRGS